MPQKVLVFASSVRQFFYFTEEHADPLFEYVYVDHWHRVYVHAPGTPALILEGYEYNPAYTLRMMCRSGDRLRIGFVPANVIYHGGKLDA